MVPLLYHIPEHSGGKDSERELAHVRLQPCAAASRGVRNNYFTEMCSGSEAGSYLRLIGFVYHSTLGLREIKKNLDSLAEELALAFLLDDLLVHLPGRDVVVRAPAEQRGNTLSNFA